MTMMPERLTIDELKEMITKFAAMKSIEIDKESLERIDQEILKEVNQTVQASDGRRSWASVIVETLSEEDIVDPDEFSAKEFAAFMLKDGMD